MTRVGGHRVFVATGRQNRGQGTSDSAAVSSHRFWQIAVLTAAGTIARHAQAEAAVFWSDSRFRIFAARSWRRRSGSKNRRRSRQKQIETPEKEAAKPQGPLIIAISIDQQNVKIYDANGFFAETPVSTGMAGHPTPMGVFSVIQKQKLHHSNIYSGAPMPFMQRITWSGIAMHAGVLPGYPASHGCIRMPMAFAVKMYGWTKMGARVVVTPGEMTPASFRIRCWRPESRAAAGRRRRAEAGRRAAKSDKAASADAGERPEASLELRSTVGHDSHLSAVIDQPSGADHALSEQTHTADASASPSTKAPGTMSDADDCPRRKPPTNRTPSTASRNRPKSEAH